MPADTCLTTAHASSVSDTAEVTDLLMRVSQLEQFNGEVAQAIDSLVTTVLDVQQKAEALKSPPPAPVRSTQEIDTLRAKVKELENRLAQEAMVRHVAEVSKVHPKSRTAVFLGRKFFCDNIKYTWLAMTERAQQLGVDCWFLPLDEATIGTVEQLGGGRCLPFRASEWTAEHVNVVLSAAVLVTDDHFITVGPNIAAFLAGARHVQLWHGIGIKNVGYANIPPLNAFSAHTAKILSTCGPFSTFVSTSACLEAEWRRSFAFERYVTMGYARNDVLYREPDARDLVNVDTDSLASMREARRAGGRVFLYAPTFRDARLGIWITEIGLDHIAQQMRLRGDTLIVNLHPCEQDRLPQLQTLMPHVRFVQANTDIYPLLRESDALITDYSSVLFDYLHLDRPIIQFQPDYEQYVTRSRSLHDDKDTTLVGPVLKTPAELLSLLATPALETSAHKAKRQELLTRLYEVRDGRSGERLCSLITEEIERAMQRVRMCPPNPS